MSSAGNSNPSASNAGLDAYQLLQLGIPPDQAVRIAALTRATQIAPTRQPLSDSSFGPVSALGAKSPMTSDPWAIFPNVDQDSLLADQRGFADGTAPTSPILEARELHPDAPNWYGEHSRWHPHWLDGATTWDPQTHFQQYFGEEPFQYSIDGGKTWLGSDSKNSVFGFHRDRDGNVYDSSGYRFEFRPLMTS